LFQKASRSKGITGEVLLQLLESRLDNVVFRLGIAPTRSSARQLISHKHIMLNGIIHNIPSYIVKPSDIISVREKSKSLEVVLSSLSQRRHHKYSWIEWNNDLMSGKFLNIPERSEIPENIKEQLIVELYSK
jgi:small subunit ribosomal protein S4